MTIDLGFTGTGTNGTDYNPSASTITILAGSTTGNITLTGVDDTIFEGNETAIVDIPGVTNGTESVTQQVTCVELWLKIAIYPNQYKPVQDWQAVAIFARRSIEPKLFLFSSKSRSTIGVLSEFI